MVCLYVELFDGFFEPNENEKKATQDLIKFLAMEPRWPEMVTFEEMNVSVPAPKYKPIADIAVRLFYAEAMSKGFIAGAKEILDHGRGASKALTD